MAQAPPPCPGYAMGMSYLPRLLLAGLSSLSMGAQASAGENWHATVNFEAAKTAASADKTWFPWKPVVTPERRAEIRNLKTAELKARGKTMLDSLAPQFSGTQAEDVADWTRRIWQLSLDAEQIRQTSFSRCYAGVTKDSTQPYERIIARVKACSDLQDLRLAVIYGNLIPRILDEQDLEHPSGRRTRDLATGWALALTLDEAGVLEREYADATGLSDAENEMKLSPRSK